MGSSVMLMGAVLSALAFGVLVAYGVCQVMFRVFRVHSIAAAQRDERKATGARVATET